MYGQVNKLFILGNGFDLAHGLKTRYKDFIDNFWKEEKNRILSSSNYDRSPNDYSVIYNDDILEIKSPRTIATLPEGYISQNAEGYEWFDHLISNSVSSNWHFPGIASSRVDIIIKNTFLQRISERNHLVNWVDIESEYYNELNNDKNPIIFGYGDELDEEYLKIESSNDNNYLENIKSIKYMQTPNYQNLLSFIESYNYDVYIMGHSCGMSDRTLLNTIFEHKNCGRIKIFYHKREDGTDDHNEKIMNISRNFKDKPLMRAKVVDKTNCEPLI